MRDDYTNYVNECAYKYIRALVREMIILIFFFFYFLAGRGKAEALP